MTRPRRLYTTTDGKFYYLIDGKKKFVKVPAGISQKQVAKINIRNIVNAPTTKRIKRRRKRIEPAYGAKVGSALAQSNTGGLPIYFFKPKKQIPTLQEQAETSADTTVDKLTKSILKLVPSSSKIEPTITPPAPASTPASTPSITGYDDAIKSAISNTGEMDNIWFNQKNEEYDFDANRQSYKTYLKRVIDSFELDEDKSKEIFKQYSNNKDFEQTYLNTLEKWVQEWPSESGSSRSSVSLSMSPSPPSSVPSTPISMRGIFGRFNEDTLQTDVKGKQDFQLPKGDLTPSETSGAEESKTSGGGAGDGLYNDEIEKIVKKRIKNYVPVIASDEINQLPRYVARGDKRFGFVINTNPSTSDGSGNDGYRTGHWRAVYINNEDDYPTVEYFDPLAEGKMPPELITICRKIAIKMNPSMMFKYKQNMLRRQSKVTSTCGHHAIKFLDDRYNGVPWSEATGYDDYMEKHSSPPDDSQDGEKDIAKTIKKYESYI